MTSVCNGRCKLITSLCFFFSDTPTTEMYTLSLHDALPIFMVALYHRQQTGCGQLVDGSLLSTAVTFMQPLLGELSVTKEPRSEEHTLNSSHVKISYAVFCLKKKNTTGRQEGTGSSPYAATA